MAVDEFEAIATKEAIIGTATIPSAIITSMKLGDLTTGIKMKKLTGTTGASENDETNIAHGLTVANIISMTCLVSNGADIWLQPEHTDTAELQYSCMVSSANVIIKLHPTNSGSILSENIIVLITYEG